MSVLRTATVTATISAAAMGGVFFAFSTFIMPALGRLRDPDAIVAMQAINRAAPTPWFMIPLFGTAAIGIGLGIHALTDLRAPASRYELIGAGLYLGAIVLTAAFHVPRNDALARLDPSAVDAASTWADYLRSWTRANHLRTLGTLGAAVAWSVALLRA